MTVNTKGQRYPICIVSLLPAKPKFHPVLLYIQPFDVIWQLVKHQEWNGKAHGALLSIHSAHQSKLSSGSNLSKLELYNFMILSELGVSTIM